jgi:GxxExxY protein
MNNSDKKEIMYKDESYCICSCIFEVNRKLGSGFLESVYQEALEIELEKAKIPFEAKKAIQILYDGKPLSHFYIADIICYGKIVIELKAVTKIINEHKAQVLNYLAATGLRLGFIVNFHCLHKAEIVRIVR